jgi:DnaK suppressor protein
MAVKKGAKKKAKPKAKKKAIKKSAKKKVGIVKKKTAKKNASNRPAKRSRPGGAEKQPPKSPLTAKRSERLKKILYRKRAEVVKELEQQMGRKLTMEAGQKIDSAMDSGDMSLQDMDQGIDYSLLEMKYEQYKDIADAFRKLQNGTYGLCEECGQEVDIKRLEVTPLARYCITCKQRKEELEKIQKEETRFKE